jgi:UDP-N-acetylglucosamine acyltransferase
MATSIHPTAIVDKTVEIGDGTTIGPYCVLSGKVRLGKTCNLISGVNISGPVTIGDNAAMYPGASIGFPPQDYKFKPGMATAGVVIGDDCIFREHTTVHAASKMEAPTRLGNKVFMMACSHVGHDALVGNNVILVNAALLAGHTQVDDNATLSGHTAIHQFCRMGRLAFLGGGFIVTKDIPPFCIVGGRNEIHGLNVVGLRRNGFARDHITLVRRAFWDILRLNIPRPEMVARLREREADCPPIKELADFVQSSKRGICYGAVNVTGEEEPEMA